MGNPGTSKKQGGETYSFLLLPLKISRPQAFLQHCWFANLTSVSTISSVNMLKADILPIGMDINPSSALRNKLAMGVLLNIFAKTSCITGYWAKCLIGEL